MIITVFWGFLKERHKKKYAAYRALARSPIQTTILITKKLLHWSISEAHTVLSDVAERQKYDRQGSV